MEKHISGCVYLSKAEIEGVLKQPPVQGKKLMEPLKAFAIAAALPLNLLEDADVTDNKAEIHTHEHDLWLGLEGESYFVIGGVMVDPFFSKAKDGTEKKNEIRSLVIKGGTEITVRPGDWLWVPAGVPHQHQSPKGAARLAIIKIPVVGK